MHCNHFAGGIREEAVRQRKTAAALFRTTAASFSLQELPCCCGALDRIRTYDLPLRRRTLYPLSYEGKERGERALKRTYRA